MREASTLRELTDRSDIDFLIRDFYARLMVDPEIGKFFTEVVVIDLEGHVPRIVDFWESILFGSIDYQGDPMAVHMRLNDRSPLLAEHFDVWLLHFDACVDEWFTGENAERAKQRAHSIATIMQIKLSR